MFRSVDMSYVQMLIPSVCAEDFADRIAHEECLQFTDLNEDVQPFQRRYTGDIISIQEIERQIKSIEELLKEYGIEFDSDIFPQDLEQQRPINVVQIIEMISKNVRETYNRLLEQSTAEQQLDTELTSQQSLISVLSQLDRMLLAREVVEERLIGSSGNENNLESDAIQLVPNRDGNNREVGFRYFAGVVSIGQRVAFERQIFLTSRGNSLIKFDESGQANQNKIPFVIFFVGDELKRSLKRLCQYMNIQICYESDSNRTREELLNEAQIKHNDFARIHTATKNQLNRDMKTTAQNLKLWKISLIQEKGIRVTLNKFHVSNNVFRAEGWCPSVKKTTIQQILDDVTANRGIGVRAVLTDHKPKGIVPTYFESTALLSPFQAIVNTYGVPRYKEFNPTIPTIVTFPFLFGVMYGDIFHGSFLFLFGIVLVLGARFYRDMRGEMAQGLYNARYVFLLMGFFALYCGLIYNDCMSISINGWNRSQWRKAETTDGTTVLVQKNNIYLFGIDPSWGGVSNQLTFENSLKMKLSIIIGVTQMTFGLFLKLSNHLYENDMISIFCEFIPQLIFMLSFFGYMVFLIIYKWCLNWGTLTYLPETPSLITVLIKMILTPGTLTDSITLYDTQTQKTVQVILLVLMFISIPWMLIPKPFLLKRKYEQTLLNRERHEHDVENTRENTSLITDEDDEKTDLIKKEKKTTHGNDEHEEFDMSEIVIHQLIHTIEYVLGTVSNTASYLRLWALSLAHSQLSEVFYEKTIETTLSGYSALNVVESVVACFMFLGLTSGVLLAMDVLECFLHSLRLHWVEFQNKFYYADGIAFQPFSYASKED